MTARASVLLLLLAAALAQSCQTHSCTEMGCADQVEAIAALPATITDINVTLCHNDECETVLRLEGDAECEQLPSPRYGEVCLAPEANGQRRLTMTMDLFNATARDGDVFTLRVTAAPGGDVVLEGTQTANYTESRPNGPDCEPLCRSVSLTFSG